MSAITETAQNPVTSKGGLVTLFQLDATVLGDTGIRCFTANSNPDGSAIVFDGVTYVPIDIEAEGFEWGGSSAPPTPMLKIANGSMLIGALVREFQDLVGAQITRIRTYRDFLDNGATPDPAMRFPIDVFRIERKVSHNKVYVEFELAVIFDQEGVQLPARQCIRDTCTHIYRRWNAGTGAFDYSKATCPYTGTSYFDRTGAITTQQKDNCGKRLTDCVLRFGEGNPLPTRSFPGMQRFSSV